MANVGESIAVFDKSGKVVSTVSYNPVWKELSDCSTQGKHLFGVFSHAKNAYRERKAQLVSERNAKMAEKEALKAMQTYTIDDAPSTTSSRRRRGAPSHHSGRSHHRRHRRSHYEQDLHSTPSRPESFYAPPQMLRRHTHHDMSVREPQSRPVTGRSKSDAYIDMDLAYGDCHPSALAKLPQESQGLQEPQGVNDKELKGLVSRAEWLLEEANCAQHTATATISHLQQNPDAMAAVALTLAEISNLASKMAPAALSALKASAPAVWSLLASPQFLVAAGVGLGVTVVAFGGYKIVKRIQASKGQESENSASMEDMMELNTECVSGVEKWRRGVADAEAESVGTSVEGEYITPTAAAMSRIDVNSTGRSRHPRSKSLDDGSMASSCRSRRSRAHHSSRAPSAIDGKSESRAGSRAGDSVAPSKTTSKAFSKSSKTPSKADSRNPDKGKSKPKEKKKGPSRLRQMFTPS